MEPGFAPCDIDTTRPHPARMYDYYLGGKNNYLVDREAAAAVLKAAPEVRAMARENRAFLQRAVRFLVAGAGIRQVIDIGTGIPAAGNVHEIASQVTAGVRVAYVDNDPIVHVHANALLTGGSNASIVLADLRDPAAILTKVAELIDFTEPVALLLIAILHFVTDQEEPGRIVTAFRDALPAGSYLALSHGTADFHEETAVSEVTTVYEHATPPLVLRSHPQVSAFFEGFELVEPGLVQVPLWRPGGRPPRPAELAKLGIYGGVGRKAA